MELIISSNDLISALISIELQSIALYILNIKSNKKAISAGLVYYIIGSISSVILIIGIVQIYIKTGETAIERGGRYDSSIIIIIISLLIKIGAAPFHNWVPDVYDGLTNDRTIIISTLGKISIIILILKIINEKNIISIIIIMSVIIGAIGGLSQYRIKRIIGYSSIAHMGWILMGNTSEAKFYLIQYIISVIIIISNIIKKMKSSTAIIISIFSLAGIPPMIGFFAKLQIIYITIINGNYLICIILIITSIISTVYYLRMIVNIINISERKKNIENSLIISILTIYQILYFIL